MEEPEVLQFDRLPKENTKAWIARMDDMALAELVTAMGREQVRRAMERKRKGSVMISV